MGCTFLLAELINTSCCHLVKMSPPLFDQNNTMNETIDSSSSPEVC
jgi:hypothetical protein